jgi:hypothetical protein
MPSIYPGRNLASRGWGGGEQPDDCKSDLILPPASASTGEVIMDNRNQFQKWFDADEKVATGVIIMVIVLMVAAYFASQSTGPSGYHPQWCDENHC